jgi:hypothetical protein
MYNQLMLNGKDKRDVGGVFRSADVPGPVFRAPIPYKELESVTQNEGFAKLRQLLEQSTESRITLKR